MKTIFDFTGWVLRKKWMLICCWFLFPLGSIAQNLSIDEMLSLRKKDAAEAEEYLSAKGWEMLNNEIGYSKLSALTFSYQKSTYSDAATAFMKYLYSNYSDTKRVSIQIHNPEKYNAYLARVKALGFKLVDTNLSEGSIEKVYQGSATTIMISVDKSSNSNFYGTSSTIYHFLFVSNEDYQENYQD